MGAVFMTAFFMISGYSLFVNYASKNLAEFQNMKPFWRKRFIGIVPLYYVASLLFILFCHVWYTVLGNGTYSVMDELRLAPIEILGLQSIFHSLFSLSHNGGTWFVSCILLCYLVYPLLQEVARQISTKARLVLLCLFAGILLYAPFIVNRYQIETIYPNPFFRILEFSIGVLLAALKPTLDRLTFSRKFLYRWITVAAVGLVMYFAVAYAVRHDYAIGDYMLYSRICLPCFALMLIGLSGVESRVLSKSRVVAYCSGIGYAFFLAQLCSNTISKIIIDRHSIADNRLIILVGWSVCAVIAVFLHEVFEKPIKKALKKKF